MLANIRIKSENSKTNCKMKHEKKRLAQDAANLWRFR